MRIIGGRWRGRRLHFPAGTEVRPTPDRVRETLFNWLAGRVAGAACLDLFAGSGALGMEALSRGAAAVVFVDRDARALTAIRAQYQAWCAAEPGAPVGRAEFVRADARAWLAGHDRRPGATAFDLVFLDPPFADEALPVAACTALEAAGLLAADARIYLETPARAGRAAPPGWEVLREGAAGEVGYHLLGRGRAAATTGAQTP